jgi:hypothetical protein
MGAVERVNLEKKTVILTEAGESIRRLLSRRIPAVFKVQGFELRAALRLSPHGHFPGAKN